MLKKKTSYLLLGFIFIFLIKNTVAMKFLAPACYRMDLSLAPVLFIGVILGENSYIAMLLGAKVLVAFLLGNPGIGIFSHLLIVLSDALMDAVLVYGFLFLEESVKKNKIAWSMLLSVFYVLICTVLNAIYLIRLYAIGYQTNLAGIVLAAARYNSHVEGYGSFLVWSVAPFYFAKLLLVMLFTSLLKHIFYETLHLSEQEVGKN